MEKILIYCRVGNKDQVIEPKDTTDESDTEQDKTEDTK